MVGVILAAGNGTRISKHINNDNKCTILKQGVPIIMYSLKRLAELEAVVKIIIVVNYQAENIINLCKNSINNKEIVYVYQENLNGIVEALKCAREHIGIEDFILCLGDEYYENTYYKELISEFYESKYDVLLGTVEVKDRNFIKNNYSIEFNEAKEVVNLEEKPICTPNNIMGTGSVIFKQDVLKYINEVKVNSRFNQIILVDLIKIAIEKKMMVRFNKVADRYLNINTFEDLKTMNKM